MIKLLPEIIFMAKAKNKPLGAYRVWFLAKHFDRGNGFISKKNFKRYLKSLDIQKSTLYRWLDQAEVLGLLENNGQVYRLESWQGAARSVGVKHVLRFTKIDMDRFIHSNWLPWVYAGFLKHFEGKPIARETLKALTDIPPRTQLEYENHINIQKTANYSDICDPQENPDLAIKVMGSPGYYGANGRIRKRLPNTYQVEDVWLGNKGRIKQINKALSNEVSSRIVRYPFYCLDAEQQRRNIRTIRRHGNAQDSPGFVFRYRTTKNNINHWDAVLF